MADFKETKRLILINRSVDLWTRFYFHSNGEIGNAR